MKTKQELLSMLFYRLEELQKGLIKKANPQIAEYFSIELALLYEILGDEVPKEYHEQIEKEIEIKL